MKANKKGKILIRYMNIDREKYSDLPYEHNQKMSYTKKNLAGIIETVLSGGHTIMIRPYTALNLPADIDYVSVYIGRGRMN